VSSLSTIEDLKREVTARGIELIECVFCSPLGSWHHHTVHPQSIDERLLLKGLPFDGSSIRLFRDIDESDMLMVPDLSTAFIDPFRTNTLVLICSVKEPLSDEWYRRDSRVIAHKAVEYAKATGIADETLFGPKSAFFVFDNVHYHVGTNSSAYCVDGVEGYWNSKKDQANMGHRPGPTSWYLSTGPIDRLADVRSDILLTLLKVGIKASNHHHEVATSQCQVGFAASSLIRAADEHMIFKHIVKNVAANHGKTATFLPKPIYNDNGSGMHIHQSLWKMGKPLFFGDGPAV
jgi:glutamine synthetase